MKQIRKGVFETNSSSTHSITICTREDFNKFKSGELVFDCCSEKLAPVDSHDIFYCKTYKDFFSGDLETYVEGFVTPSGDEVVAFGKYGYDG